MTTSSTQTRTNRS